MKKLKRGDKLICTNKVCSSELIINNIYTFEEYSTYFDDCIVLRELNSNWTTSQFELLISYKNESKFRKLLNE